MNLEKIIKEVIITTTTTILREIVTEIVERGGYSLKMSVVCTAVMNGATASQIPIIKRETTRTATFCPNACLANKDATNTTIQAVQASAPTPLPITREDDQQAAVATSDLLIRRNHA